jgi:glycolate oxidase FAD binding subunit
VMTVKAGTLLAEVEALLAEQGQCFPFEPPHFSVDSRLETLTQPPHDSSGSTIGGKEIKHATVGGMVAAGLSGPARAVAGSVRDYVLGAHLINGKGQLLQFGGTVMKNVAGYDVSRLLAGSIGALGLITQVSLKVLPIAPREATLRFQLDEAAMIQQVNNWAGQPLPINASSWVIDRDTDGGQGALYLRLRGAVAAVESACKMFSDQHGAMRVDSPETAADWHAARDLQLPWFEEGFKRGDDLWRISVPPTTPPLGLGDTMIDWLGGQRWVFTLASTPEEQQQSAHRIRTRVAQAEGNATLFIANYADSMPTIGRFDALKPPLDRIHQQLKKEFDLVGIFNPGRLGVI